MTTPGESVLPAVIEALVALWRAAMPQVQVVDGPPTVDVRGTALLVGWTPLTEQTQGVFTPAGLRVERESVPVVPCVARTWSGSADVAAQRRDSFAVVTKAREALRAYRTLGGLVLEARVGGYTYAPMVNDQGQLVIDVVFSVDITHLA